MKFHSSRDPTHTVSLSEAIRQGLAPDGGLYLPDSLPAAIEAQSLALSELAHRILTPFFSGDFLAPALPDIAREAMNFPAPLQALTGAPSAVEVLELFHGPTCAFKDFGARFLAASLQRLRTHSTRPLTILVATSGDTGGAVAAAFHQKTWAEVVVLFPKGRVSPRQEKQLTCWGGNVRSLAVRGTFDDCQRLVKAAFVDPQMTVRLDLSSANSINIGRLLPQLVYYAMASLDIKRRTGGVASFIVPSGNLGNVMACLWAKKIGLPMGEVVLAHNANRAVPDWIETGQWRPSPSIATLASAMDVGHPSNIERLQALFPSLQDLREHVSATSVSDAQISARIREDFAAYGRIWCPHTAVAAEAYARMSRERQRAHHWVLVATAHPAKFSEIVEPLIEREIEVPVSLAALLALPNTAVDLEPSGAALRQYLLS